MNRLIIIIHSTEIIRKGLAAILRGYFNTEILVLEKTDELEAYLRMKNHTLVIILEFPEALQSDYIQTLKKNNQVKLIEFCNQEPADHTVLPLCDHCINLHAPAPEIMDIISECWAYDTKSKRLPENEELTRREKEVLQLVAMGFSNKIIADKLFISTHTVISHRKNISEKLGIKSISGLTIYAILNNLIEPNTLEPGDLI